MNMIALIIGYSYVGICTGLIISRFYKSNESGRIIGSIIWGVMWPIFLPIIVFALEAPPWHINKKEQK